MILRELISFESQGADVFFGEPEFDTKDFLRTTADGKGMISLVELPNLQDRPALFSTFLMWLLADLFHDLPEVGDTDKPSLVFFFDEAHLLFSDASKDFLQAITQTVRLIRSKGVGVFFVTQSPTDVPDDVLAQLGSRVQHQLRAATPNDAKALKATVNTYPTSAYDDLGQVILTLGIGEAIITVMNERGAPTPVAWTRLRAPESLMGPADPAAMDASVKASPLFPTYSQEIDRESAREMLAKKVEAGCGRRREGGAAVRRRAPPLSEEVDHQGQGGQGRHGREGDEVVRHQGVHAHRSPGDRPGRLRHRPPALAVTPESRPEEHPECAGCSSGSDRPDGGCDSVRDVLGCRLRGPAQRLGQLVGRRVDASQLLAALEQREQPAGGASLAAGPVRSPPALRLRLRDRQVEDGGDAVLVDADELHGDPQFVLESRSLPPRATTLCTAGYRFDTCLTQLL